MFKNVKRSVGFFAATAATVLVAVVACSEGSPTGDSSSESTWGTGGSNQLPGVYQTGDASIDCDCAVTTCSVPGQTACGTTCTDLTSDPNNCGSCENVCDPGATCTAGQCECPSGQTNCGGCTDTSSDIDNCGGCGNGGVSGQSCVNGQLTGCGTGTTLCNGICVDTTSDPGNCGSCGSVCAENECNDGTCATEDCPLDTCDDGCTDLQTDPANCGNCETVCAAGNTCISGFCTGAGECPGNTEPCPPTGACVDITTDNNNCGNCGSACSSGTTCNAGACQ